MNLSLEAFTVTELNKIFLGIQPHHVCKFFHVSGADSVPICRVLLIAW